VRNVSKKERLGNGGFHAGTNIGAIITPLIVRGSQCVWAGNGISAHRGSGFAWLILWLFSTENPRTITAVRTANVSNPERSRSAIRKNQMGNSSSLQADLAFARESYDRSDLVVLSILDPRLFAAGT